MLSEAVVREVLEDYMGTGNVTDFEIEMASVIALKAYRAGLEAAAVICESWQAEANLLGMHEDHDKFRDLAAAIRERIGQGESDG